MPGNAGQILATWGPLFMQSMNKLLKRMRRLHEYRIELSMIDCWHTWDTTVGANSSYQVKEVKEFKPITKVSEETED